MTRNDCEELVHFARKALRLGSLSFLPKQLRSSALCLQLHLSALHELLSFLCCVFFSFFLCFAHVCFLFAFSLLVSNVLVHLLPPRNGCAGKIRLLGGGKGEKGLLFFHSIEQSWLLLPFLTLQYYWN